MGEHTRKILLEKYEIGRLLGKGSFAKVYYGRNIKTSQSVAIKVIEKEKIFKCGIMDQVKREISVMMLVKHPNIVQLYEVMATKTKIYFVLEYVKGGHLSNKIRRGRLKEDVARRYFQQLNSAVDFCHSRGVYHRDLKPENLLLDENRNLKISDFGLSALEECKRKDGFLHTTCGTPAFVAPELMSKKGYDGVKADIWACGVILYVLLAGYLPSQDKNLMEMYKKIHKAKLKWPSWFSLEARRLLQRILDPNPSTRISFSEILENPWFRIGIDSKLSSYSIHIKDVIPFDMDPISDTFSSNTTEGDQEREKPTNLNAFAIISLLSGFDLSGMFVNKFNKEFIFTSTSTTTTIITKLEDIAKSLQLKLVKKAGGLLKMESLKHGRKGAVSMSTDIFHITPEFHIVQMKKTNGDTLEYVKIKQAMRPALKDIVWAWQDEQPQIRCDKA